VCLTKSWAPLDTNGTDLFPALLNELRNMPCRLFLLGSHLIVVSVAAQRIKERWKHVEIVGYKDGYFSNDQIPLIRDAVERARSTLFLIGLGSPRQEEVALDFLQVPDLQWCGRSEVFLAFCAVASNAHPHRANASL
jgi:N-acetylglucosaminyldiphosphoundecaprenol N-acetyl-beta-D-mannosaminyltransferase